MAQHLILLHGALGSKLQFAALQKLLGKYFNIHTFNFDGHGGNAPDEDFSIELFSANLTEFIDENNIENTDLFGYSMGGYVALNFAKNHPDKVRRIITLGTKFDWSPAVSEKEMQHLNPAKMEKNVPAFANRLKEVHTAGHWENVVVKTAKMMHDLGAGKKMVAADFEQIKQPVLIGIGEMDRMVSLEESENIVQILPNGSLKQIENFQHPIEKIDVEILADIIHDFLLKN